MFRSILQSRWFTVIAILIVGFFAVSLIKIAPVLVITDREATSLNQRIAEIKQAASELEKFGDFLNSESYLERQARLKLNYKKPDENVVFVYQKPNIEVPSQSIEVSPATKNGFSVCLRQWWGYLIREIYGRD